MKVLLNIYLATHKIHPQAGVLPQRVDLVLSSEAYADFSKCKDDLNQYMQQLDTAGLAWLMGMLSKSNGLSLQLAGVLHLAEWAVLFDGLPGRSSSSSSSGPPPPGSTESATASQGGDESVGSKQLPSQISYDTWNRGKHLAWWHMLGMTFSQGFSVAQTAWKYLVNLAPPYFVSKVTENLAEPPEKRASGMVRPSGGASSGRRGRDVQLPV
jgi:hypothetical protein